MIMESSSDVRDRYFSSTLDQEVTPDHHQAPRRENNRNWCHYAKTKTSLGGDRNMFGSNHRANCVHKELYWSSKQSKTTKERHKSKTNSKI